MRVPLMVLFVTMPVAAIAADRSVAQEPASPSATCSRTTSYLADKGSLYPGAPLTPKKLTELPPATGYMAVYRRINGCEAPLTMVEYRGAKRR